MLHIITHYEHKMADIFGKMKGQGKAVFSAEDKLPTQDIIQIEEKREGKTKLLN